MSVWDEIPCILEESSGPQSNTKSLIICGRKRWCPKNLRVSAPAAPWLTHSLPSWSLKVGNNDLITIKLGSDPLFGIHTYNLTNFLKFSFNLLNQELGLNQFQALKYLCYSYLNLLKDNKSEKVTLYWFIMIGRISTGSIKNKYH